MDMIFRLLYGAGVACVLIGVILLVLALLDMFALSTALILLVVGVILAVVAYVISGHRAP